MKGRRRTGEAKATRVGSLPNDVWSDITPINACRTAATELAYCVVVVGAAAREGAKTGGRSEPGERESENAPRDDESKAVTMVVGCVSAVYLATSAMVHAPGG